MTSKTLRQAAASAWILLVSPVLAACGSVVAASYAVAPASSAPPGFTGYDWPVAAIGRSGRVTPIPRRLGVTLQFSPRGEFGAFDGISFHSGTYQATPDSFTISGMATTLNGYAGDDQDIVLARLAMGSLGDPATHPVRLTGDRLVVDLGSYTLTCYRAGPRADTPAPASTR